MTVYQVVVCDKCGPGYIPTSSYLQRRPSCLYQGTRAEALEAGWTVYRDGSGDERHRCQECTEIAK